MKTSSMITALLFSRTEPWAISELSKVLEKNNEEINEALAELENNLANSGLCLIRAADNITLSTDKEASTLLEKIYKDDLEKSLSKASIETLSIIMYGEEVTRAKIDYIRGVNSGFILRSLLVRGLIERRQKANDKKTFIYLPTIALLSSLGVNNTQELPDYEKIHGEIIKSSTIGKNYEENISDNQENA